MHGSVEGVPGDWHSYSYWKSCLSRPFAGRFMLKCLGDFALVDADSHIAPIAKALCV